MKSTIQGHSLLPPDSIENEPDEFPIDDLEHFTIPKKSAPSKFSFTIAEQNNGPNAETKSTISKTHYEESQEKNKVKI